MLMIQSVTSHHRCLIGHLAQVLIIMVCIILSTTILGMMDYLAKVHSAALKRKEQNSK